MKHFVVFFVFIVLGSCSNTKGTADVLSGEIIDLKKDKAQITVIEAKLIRKKAYNKAGREMPYAGDFYLVYEGKEVFVKLMDSEVTSEDLEPLLDKKSKFEIIESDGLWDTDNPEVQSRVGPYLEIIKILPD